jgi:hypothetical protein
LPEENYAKSGVDSCIIEYQKAAVENRAVENRNERDAGSAEASVPQLRPVEITNAYEADTLYENLHKLNSI